MPITKINSTTIGRSSILSEIGSTELAFVFPNLPSELDAVAQTHGFIDALLASAADVDGSGLDTGVLNGLVPSEVLIVPQLGGGVQAQFTLPIEFEFGDRVERWLDSSGLLDDELVKLSVGPIEWTLNEATGAQLEVNARAAAIDVAHTEAEEFALILDAETSPRLAELEQLSYHVRHTLEQPAGPTLGDLLDARPRVELDVTVRTVWTILV